MTGSLSHIYSRHHAQRRDPGFVLGGADRGLFLRSVIGTGKQVLDIGCRDGALTAAYAEGNTVVGLDIDPVALARAQQSLHIETRLVDLNGDWGTAPATFDAVVAAEVLEHLYFPSEVLSKIHAALRPGGLLVGSIPNAFSVQTKLRFLFGRKYGTPLMDPTHINHFSVTEFKDLLAGAGFTSIIIKPLRWPKWRWTRLVWPFGFAYGILFSART